MKKIERSFTRFGSYVCRNCNSFFLTRGYNRNGKLELFPTFGPAYNQRVSAVLKYLLLKAVESECGCSKKNDVVKLVKEALDLHGHEKIEDFFKKYFLFAQKGGKHERHRHECKQSV